MGKISGPVGSVPCAHQTSDNPGPKQLGDWIVGRKCGTEGVLDFLSCSQRMEGLSSV